MGHDGHGVSGRYGTVTLPPKFDPLALDVAENPYPTYRRLRDAGPLCRGGAAQWVVTRHADVVGLVGDPRLGSEFGDDYYRIALGAGPLAEFFANIVLNRDPPEHTVLRKLLGRAFTARAVRERQVRIDSLVDELLVPAMDEGRFDAVTRVAEVLPIRTLADFLGMDERYIDAVRPRALALSRAFATHLPVEQRSETTDALVWLRALVAELLDDKRRSPGNGLLSQLAQTHNEGLDRQVLVDNVVFLLFAGFSTTTDLLSTGCAVLAAHPDQLALLRTRPTLVPRAVEELLRFDAPVQVKSRIVREPLEVGGRSIRPGRVLLLLLGSANHDERRFHRPERLDVTRHPNPHVAFGGGGIHQCLGATLARAEATAVFNFLATRFATVELDGPVIRRHSASFRSCANVPIRVTVARRQEVAGR